MRTVIQDFPRVDRVVYYLTQEGAVQVDLLTPAGTSLLVVQRLSLNGGSLAVDFSDRGKVRAEKAPSSDAEVIEVAKQALCADEIFVGVSLHEKLEELEALQESIESCRARLRALHKAQSSLLLIARQKEENT